MFLGKMVSYIENYVPNDSACFARSLQLRGRAERLCARVGCSAPLVLLSHAACGDEAESSRVPYDLPQGECRSVPRCVPPLKHQKHFGKVL